MTDIAKVREMSDKELEDALQRQAGPLERALRALDPPAQRHQQHPETRHQIARILTVQRERGLGWCDEGPRHRRAGPRRRVQQHRKGRVTDGHDPTDRRRTAARGQRKTKVGRVVSDKMDKTIVVSVERLTRHRLYKRVIR